MVVIFHPGMPWTPRCAVDPPPGMPWTPLKARGTYYVNREVWTH
jgi:hypothetical protein